MRWNQPNDNELWTKSIFENQSRKNKGFFPHCMPGTGTSSEAFTFEVWRNDFRCPTHVLCIQVLLFPHRQIHPKHYTIWVLVWSLIKNNTRIWFSDKNCDGYVVPLWSQLLNIEELREQIECTKTSNHHIKLGFLQAGSSAWVVSIDVTQIKIQIPSVKTLRFSRLPEIGLYTM